jgi:hypothetical protein
VHAARSVEAFSRSCPREDSPPLPPSRPQPSRLPRHPGRLQPRHRLGPLYRSRRQYHRHRRPRQRRRPRPRRLARALISDVAAYHPERLEIGLREGRLKELFQEELRKSWQEYVEQVGIEVAKSTPYFRDALNEILAKGKKVF